MKRNGQFIKFAFYLALLVSSSAWLTQFTASQSQTIRRPKFSAPLKGTEILLEADQIESKQKRRGIWALEPRTGKARFLIPNGTRPFWSPKRNYIAYQEHNEIKVVDKTGRIEVSATPVFFEGGQLIGWGHNEEFILYTAPGLTGGFCFLRFNPKEPSLTEAGFVDPSEHFPGHHFGNPAISPDGKYIVFEAFRYAPGIGKVSSKLVIAELTVITRRISELLEPDELARKKSYSVEIDVKNVRRLTSLPMEFMEVNPQWSPDGRKIAFEIVGPQKVNRIVHVINLDGSGLKGLHLRIEKVKKIISGNTYHEEEVLLRVQEGLVTDMETYKDHDFKVIGWLSNSQIVVAQSIVDLTRYINPMNEPITGLLALEIVDVEQRHPPILTLFTGRISKFLCLSPWKKQFVWGEGFDDFLTSVYLFDIPKPQKTEQPYIQLPLPEPIRLPKSLAVYWANW